MIARAYFGTRHPIRLLGWIHATCNQTSVQYLFHLYSENIIMYAPYTRV